MKMLGHMVVAILQDVTLGELNDQLLNGMGAKPVVMQIAQQLAVGEMAGGDVIQRLVPGDGFQLAAALTADHGGFQARR